MRNHFCGKESNLPRQDPVWLNKRQRPLVNGVTSFCEEGGGGWGDGEGRGGGGGGLKACLPPELDARPFVESLHVYSVSCAEEKRSLHMRGCLFQPSYVHAPPAIGVVRSVVPSALGVRASHIVCVRCCCCFSSRSSCKCP